MVDREAVRANAKYLRNVRPIDPEEIHEYVEGQPHPGVVRRVLREEAFDLGLFERDDGTFVPLSDAPVQSPSWRPDALPDRYAEALEELLVDRYGPSWYEGDSGDRLRETIRRLKADYYDRNPVEYDADAALGYAVYHLADYYAAVGYVLDVLTERDLLTRRLRVLDVGAGVGGPALGLHDYLPERSLVDYHAVEPSAAAEVLDRLLGETRRNFHATVHRDTAETFDPEGTYDLVLFSNVLSELDDPVAVADRYLDVVADDGSFVAVEPADLHTSTGLREVERALAPADGDVTVYAPTLRLWPGEAPSDRGWTFDVAPDVDAPGFQRRLDRAGGGDGTFLKTAVQFSYAVLRTDGARRFDVTATPSEHAKMAEMERHVTERVDLLAVKLSHDLADEGNPVFKVGDGSESVEQYAVLTRESPLNAALREARYGEVLVVENVLVLWNDDEGAYNLVVDGETYVDRLV